LKYTDSNQDLFAELCSGRAAGEGLWWGRDEELLDGVEAGATGAIGSSYNYAGRLYEPILGLRGGGELVEAQRAQERAVEMIELIASFGYFGAAKAVMGFLGVPVGPTRMPLGNPSGEGLERLRAGLDELGFFDWVRV